MEFTGEFETHVTVRADDPAAVETIRGWADRHGLKFHHIELARGATPSQPMVTRRGTGTLTDERTAADDLARHLAADGFTVVRVKIEAAPWNRGVPESDADAEPGRYFEHHVKLLLEPHADLGVLTTLAERHAAHLSRNARRTRDDGKHERFVTQWCHAVGRATAADRLAALVRELAGYEVLGVEQEYVVEDTAPGADAGWLDGGAS